MYIIRKAIKDCPVLFLNIGILNITKSVTIYQISMPEYMTPILEIGASRYVLILCVATFLNNSTAAVVPQRSHLYPNVYFPHTTNIIVSKNFCHSNYKN